MPNIVPKNAESGQLGRLNRRWLELHTKLAHVDTVILGEAPENPEANHLYVTPDNTLMLGANQVALQSSIDSLSALINAFFSENGENGVSGIIESFGADYDTLRELIDGLETLSGYATTEYVDGEITTLASTISGINTELVTINANVNTNSSNITTLQGSVASNTTGISNINGSISDINTSITGLSSDVSNNSGSITTIQGDIAGLNSSVSANTTSISNANNSINSLQTIVSNLELDDLSDVALGTVSQGNILKYDSGAWTASSFSDLNLSGTIGSVQIRGANGLDQAEVVISYDGVDDATINATSSNFLNIGTADLPVKRIDASAIHTASLDVDGLNINGSNNDLVVADTTDIKRSSDASGLFTRVSDLENAPAVASSLSALNDVNIGTLTNGGALVYNGSEWVAGSVDIDALQQSVTNLQSGAGNADGNEGDIQVNDGLGGFESKGIVIDSVSSGSTISSYVYSKNYNNLVNIGRSGFPVNDVYTDKVSLFKSSLANGELTGTASTLSYNGSAIATQSYVDANTGAITLSTGGALQFEVSNGSGGLTPIGLTAVNTGSTLTGLIPNGNEQVDLGSASNKFKDLYLSGNSIHLGSAELTATASTLSFGGAAIAKANELNSVASDVSTLSSRVGTLETSSSSITSSLSQVSTDITSLASSIDSLQATDTLHDSRITGAQSTADSAQTAAGAAQTMANALNTRLTTAESDIDSLQAADTNFYTLAGQYNTKFTSIGTATGLTYDSANSPYYSYTANTAATFISDAVSLQDADEKLNDQLETVTSDLATLSNTVSTLQSGSSSDVSALQDEIDATQTGAGLGTGGAYAANSGSSYIASATSLKNADDLLDAQIASNATAISANASSITALSALSTLEDLTASTVSSSALTFANNTLTLVDADIEAGTAVALASDIDLSLTGAVTGSVSFSSGGTYSITTSLGSEVSSSITANADNISSLSTTVSNNGSAISTLASSITDIKSSKQDVISAENGVVITGDTLSLDDAYTKSLFSAGGDLVYNGTLGEFSVATYSGFSSDFASKTTTDLAEGNNLYHTEARVRGSVSAGGDLVYNGTLGQFSVTTYKSADFDTDLATKSTDDLSEGSNLYYTDARVGSYLSTNSYATQTYVDTQVAGIVDTAPEALNTLNELAAALGDDPNFATTVSTQIGTKQDQLTIVDNGTLGSSLTLANGTLTYAGPSSSSIVSVFSAGSNVTITASGTISTTGTLSAQVDNIDNFTTDDLSEGSTNQYYTDARVRSAVSADGDLVYNGTLGQFSVTTYKSADFDTDLATKDTDNVSEGSTNLYFTDARARSSVSSSGDIVYNGTLGQFSVTTYKSADFSTDFSTKSTTDLVEGTNLYFTEARSRGSLTSSGDLSYDSSTGVISVTTYKSADFDSDFASKDTDALGEGSTNLYHTASRVRSSLSASGDLSYNAGTGAFSVTTYKSSDFSTDLATKSTDDLSEGSTNRYFTSARARGSIGVTYTGSLGTIAYDTATGVITYNGPAESSIRSLISATGDASYDNSTGVISVDTYKSADFDVDLATKSTDDLTEGSNLYFTDERAQDAINVSNDSGFGSLSYANGTISYAGVTASEIRGQFSAGDNVDITDGVISLEPNLTSLAHVGHVLETFDHGSIASSHSSESDLGDVLSNIIYHSVDLGGLDNGSLI